MDIKKSFNQFLEGNGKNKGRKPDERYASFDFCYNYYRGTRLVSPCYNGEYAYKI